MKIKGPWSEADIDRYLTSAVIPMRLSALGGSGWPVVLSLWFRWRDGALWCASNPQSRIVAMLAQENRCGFEIAGDTPPYRGVRGQGKATLDRDDGVVELRALIERYLGPEETSFSRWLMARSAGEVAIRIEPVRLMSWDYTARMNG